MRLTTPKTVLILGGSTERRKQLAEWLGVSLPTVSAQCLETSENLKVSLEAPIMDKDLGCVICMDDFDAGAAQEHLDTVLSLLKDRWEQFKRPKERSASAAKLQNISIGKGAGKSTNERVPLPLLLVQLAENPLTEVPADCRRLSWERLELNPELLGEHVALLLENSSVLHQNHKLKERVRRLDEELLVKQQKLAEMTETALRFTDSVSHEFRTPLTVIKEFAGIIRDGIGGPVTSQQLEFLNYIDSATRDITRLVEDFLDSSRLKAGTLYVNRRQVRILDYFERLQPLLATHAATKKIELHYIIMDETGRFFSDLDKASRCLTNLVVHGIKHACEGEKLWIWSVPLESGEYAMGVTSHPDWLQTYREQINRVTENSDAAKVNDGLDAEEPDWNQIFQHWLLTHLPVSRHIRPVVDEAQEASLQPTDFLTGASETRDSLSKWGLGLSVVEDLAWMNLGEVQLWPRFDTSIFGITKKLDEIIGTDHVGHRSFLFTVPSARLDCVLTQYVKHMMEAGMEPGFTALHVRVHDSGISGGISRDQKVRHFLASNSRSMDLVWSGQVEGEFVLLGVSDRPDAWRDRLLESWKANLDENMMEENVSLSIETIGEWSAEQVNDLSLMNKPHELRPWFRSLYELLAPLTNLERGQMHQRLKDKKREEGTVDERRSQSKGGMHE